MTPDPTPGRRRSPARIVLLAAIAAVILFATAHPQAALWVLAAAAVYGAVEAIIAWRQRRLGR